MFANAIPEIYSPREIADAAGVPEAEIRELVGRGVIRSLAAVLPTGADAHWDHFVPHDEAVRIVRSLRAGERLAAGAPESVSHLLVHADRHKRPTTVPLLVSTSLHGLVVTIFVVITSLGLTTDERTDPIEKDAQPVRLVFLAQPGPGGGGGGGGMRMRTPPPKAERRGPRPVSSPIPARRPPPPVRPAPKPVEPPPAPLEAKILPPVMAPVQPIAADTRDREGELKEAPKEAPPSQGPGVGGGAGSGKGTGIGEGNGSGIGPGEGGGMGGGPYRPGSGVEPPRLLREVRADYSDEARRAGIEGEVLLEIVVRRDGTVGDVRVLQRLGSGLDQRAIQAVRQWKFAAARMKGTPVDVIVEVGVEFKLR